MNNYVYTHIHQQKVDVELSDSITDGLGAKYRALEFGSTLTIFMDDDQLKKLFNLLDKKMNKITYSDLQDRLFCLELDLEAANETITIMREINKGE